MTKKTIEGFVNGRIENTDNGQLMVVERKLSEINSGEIAGYIKEHREKLFLNNIRRKFPQLEHIFKKRILFFDTENCGLRYSDPVFMVGMADFSDGINLKSLVARDYSEEKAVIKYFLNILPDYEAFFTYNGSSFDIPRLSERAKQNGIMLNSHSYKTLKDIIGDRHIDLYHLMRKRITIPDAKLQTVEKVIFGHAREGDISGNKIPKVYKDYVYGAEDGEKMAKLIHHNMLDTASLVGVLVYLGS